MSTNLKKYIMIAGWVGFLVLATVYFYNEISNRAFEKGFENGVQAINQRIITDLQNTGQLRLNIPFEDGTKLMILKPIEEPTEESIEE